MIAARVSSPFGRRSNDVHIREKWTNSRTTNSFGCIVFSRFRKRRRDFETARRCHGQTWKTKRHRGSSDAVVKEFGNGEWSAIDQPVPAFALRCIFVLRIAHIVPPLRSCINRFTSGTICHGPAAAEAIRNASRWFIPGRAGRHNGNKWLANEL